MEYKSAASICRIPVRQNMLALDLCIEESIHIVTARMQGIGRGSEGGMEEREEGGGWKGGREKEVERKRAL